MGKKTGGTRGRPPKPVELKILQGNPGKRPIPKKIKITDDKPACPSWLNEEAKKEWRRLVGPLHSAGILRSTDQAIFAAYCLQWSRWVKAEQNLEREEVILQTESGYRMPNPYLYVANKALEKLKSLANELGLTPTARGRLGIPEKPKDETPFAAFLARGQKK